MTECNQSQFEFEAHFSRRVVAEFSGERLTTEGGALLLRAADRKMGLLRRVVRCFRDARDPQRIEHELAEMLAQRIYGLALGYEDLNDHEQLRNDPLLGVLVGKKELGEPLAGKSTLNRLELTPVGSPWAERYTKISYSPEALDELLVDLFLEAHRQAPREIVLDLDATDTPLHGRQEARFFHGYYGHYCYLPLYIFCGEFLLCARLRPSNIDASAGSVEELKRIVAQIRSAWSQVRIVVRGDSGFCREELLAWCEAESVDYLLGLAKNERLKAEIVKEMEEAKAQYQETGRAARRFQEFVYQTRESWSRARRVVAKAEHLEKGENPRFVVTSLGREEWPAQALYEEQYCARGDMENRIKEQLMLFSDRTSTHYLRSNQLRLYFSSIAYVLLQMLRRLGLEGTELAKAQCSSIRLKLLKIGALIRITVRKVWISLAGGYPYVTLFRQIYENLCAVPVKY